MMRRQITVPQIAALWLLATASNGLSAQGPDTQSLVESLQLQEAAEPVHLDRRWQHPRKIVVTIPQGYPGGQPPDYRGELKEITGSIDVVAIERAHGQDPDPLLVGDADVFLGYCSQGMVEAMPNLRWLQHYGTGMDRCLTPSVKERDFILTNVQHTAGPPVAEHTIALLLTLTRSLHALHTEQQRGNFDRNTVLHLPMLEIGGKTMLIVGLGGIGTEIARRAAGMDMRVIGIRRSSREGPEYVEYVGLTDELYDLAGQADVIVNALPLTAETQGIYNRDFFDRVKRGAYFISISRGGNTVTTDLVAALKDGRLGGAALDVTDPEPLPSDHELAKLPNVVITPHVSFSTDRAFERGWEVVKENLRRYIAGDKLLNIVDIQRGY